MASLQLIQTYTATSSVATFTFSSIPQTYKDLMVYYNARTNGSWSTGSFIPSWKLNSQSGSGYGSYYFMQTGNTDRLSGDGGTVDMFSYTTPNNFSGNGYSGGWCYIPSYSSTQNFKNWLTQSTVPNNSSSENRQVLVAGYYDSTSTAITSIKVDGKYGDASITFFAGSIFSLYGIPNT